MQQQQDTTEKEDIKVIENESEQTEQVKSTGSNGGDQDSAKEVEKKNDATEEQQQPEEEIELIIDGVEKENTHHNDNSVMRHLRTKIKEKNKRIKELESYTATSSQKNQQEISKPKLQDFDYDEEKYEEALSVYYKEKSAADKKQKQFDQKLAEYRKKMDELPYKNKDIAEETARSALNETQQSLIVAASKGAAAKIVYAIGSNKSIADKVASIKDPVEFVAEIVRLEGRIKEQRRSSAPPPAKGVKQSTTVSLEAKQKQLEKLRELARKTGDSTPVINFRKKHGI